jgi:DNA-directed RNA polymerase specialized sigma subunit
MDMLDGDTEPLEITVEKRELLARVADRMGLLSEDERCALTLALGLDDGPCEKQWDIANCLGVGQPAVQRMIKRACTKLRNSLEEDTTHA